ncbi:sirohydrochlorin cobaltochelatase [Clostridium botulinum]|uniref:sirohydrochlorin cobaltochelatase n=1 Tax=Clostridium botulinum TaxID=1491 RepID=UPI0001F8530D|nr:sirohydrochlorin cobaltochelatase [Clostridium botulinum]KEI91307.1 sirohydrochlorin cobaltochelatase [Clostridium botulinum B2 275]MCJ8171447.1 sirohydrochlorin cobaltochelatase [Clostridium botulinum]NFB17697.1 sirohydrochlorin cobaltochelatase [Clostridium botulinum]NFB67880.1 sirohydrochlorin cobaltochelatase [Clostridium botulinum]NFB98521.1 sirohydrochlorin cobaltochelatase [Clostridium botulinum]
MNKNKRAILVVSFGTSYEQSLKDCIEGTENFIKESFKDYDIKRAFTSYMIINKILKRDNIKINNPIEALEELKNEGYEEVIVQPLHIMFGEEYEKIERAVLKFKDEFKTLKLGKPLLFKNEDYKIATEALKTQLPKLNKEEAIILMGHGTEHPANAAYFQFDYYLREHINPNIYLCSVESDPSIKSIIPKLKKSIVKNVLLMPFMLVAGDHANNDMAGEDEESWKNVLEKEGFKVDLYLKGLGANREFQKIYRDHIKEEI